MSRSSKRTFIIFCLVAAASLGVYFAAQKATELTATSGLRNQIGEMSVQLEAFRDLVIQKRERETDYDALQRLELIVPTEPITLDNQTWLRTKFGYVRVLDGKIVEICELNPWVKRSDCPYEHNG